MMVVVATTGTGGAVAALVMAVVCEADERGTVGDERVWMDGMGG